KKRHLDIVVGTRYSAGGSVGDWQKSRVLISSLAGRLARFVVKTELSGPLNGFFFYRARGFFGGRGRIVGAGRQDPDRYLCVIAPAARVRRAAVPFPPSRQRREQVGRVGRLGIPHLAARQAYPGTASQCVSCCSQCGGFGVVTHLAVLWLAVHPF